MLSRIRKLDNRRGELGWKSLSRQGIRRRNMNITQQDKEVIKKLLIIEIKVFN
jgi:hypothetical protein